MAINKYNLKKWSLMLAGKSLMHVNQGVGKCYSKDKIAGYYNDLTEKVTKDTENYNTDNLPLDPIEDGRKVLFPTQIFQYGLGAYDLYLMNNDKLSYKKFEKCVEYAAKNIDVNGRWNNFYFVYPKTPYSAMSQGEGASLLIRAYQDSGKEEYLLAAKKAINYMLSDKKNGGTCLIKSGNMILLEYTDQPAVLNGWIFAIFGLYDIQMATHETKYINAFHDSVNSLKRMLLLFDNGYWSKYNLGSKIASPFYHNLHIAQLRVLSDLSGDAYFDLVASKWENYESHWSNKVHAFFAKAVQKIIE